MAKQFKVTNQAQLEKDIKANNITFGNPAYSKQTGEELEITLSGVIEVREFKNAETGVITHPAYALSKNGFAVRIPNGVKAEDLKDGSVRRIVILENEINGRMVKYASFID